jgi:hypothetical protein
VIGRDNDDEPVVSTTAQQEAPNTRRLRNGGIVSGLVAIAIGIIALVSGLSAGILLLLVGVVDIVYIGFVLPSQIDQNWRQWQEANPHEV